MKNKKNIFLIILPVLTIAYIAFTGCNLNILNDNNINSNNTGSTVTLTDENFNNKVLNSNVPVVVDFWASWCGPCKKLSPIIDELSSEYEGKILFGKLNVDDNEKSASFYAINSIPHLIIFNNGQITEHIIGLHSKSEIEEKLTPLLNK